MKKETTYKLSVIVMALFAVTIMIAGSASAAAVNGTTLAGYKTIDICVVDPTDENPYGTSWIYSGEIAVWNEGVIDTVGLAISDFIENKTGNKWVKQYEVPISYSGEIPAGTTLETATVYPYSIEAAPLDGTIRNNVSITILNHSGRLNKPFGPNPKVTYTGEMPPPPCEVDSGCTLTQGYWGTYGSVENPHTWPTGFSRDDVFFLSGQTWQEVLDTAARGNGYYILAVQYIAAVLNEANGALVPSGVQDTLDLAKSFFESNAPTACSTASSCGLQKDWGAVLDDYNNGVYPGGPPHCE